MSSAKCRNSPRLPRRSSATATPRQLDVSLHIRDPGAVALSQGSSAFYPRRRLRASPGDRTATPKPLITGSKSRRLNVTMPSARHSWLVPKPYRHRDRAIQAAQNANSPRSATTATASSNAPISSVVKRAILRCSGRVMTTAYSISSGNYQELSSLHIGPTTLILPLSYIKLEAADACR